MPDAAQNHRSSKFTAPPFEREERARFASQNRSNSPSKTSVSIRIFGCAHRFFVRHLDTAMMNQIQEVIDRHDTPFSVVGELWSLHLGPPSFGRDERIP